MVMHPISRLQLQKGAVAGGIVRYRLRRGILWYTGFVLGFLGIKK
jgi:hypothetical protein